MASPLSTQVMAHLEGDACCIEGFVAIDGSANVVGYAPTAPGAFSATTPYTRLKGAQQAIGPAGGVLTQPHTAAGTYIFLLDEPWVAMLDAGYQLIDQGAVAPLTGYIDANVTNNTSGIGAAPGNNSALAVRTVRFRLRTTAGALADPVASTGFWIYLMLKRTAMA